MFSAVTRHGLIACRYLVEGYIQGRYISAPEISEQYNMNVRALIPALRQLTRVGILRSRTGGNEPGYIFSRSPEELSVLDIVLALEGHSEFICCKDSISGLKCDYEEERNCLMSTLCREVIDKARHRLSTITITEFGKTQ